MTQRINCERRSGKILSGCLISVACAFGNLHAQSDNSTTPPQVAIAFPSDNIFISFGLNLQVRALANAPGGSISEVQLFDEFSTGDLTGTNLIGVNTSPPYLGLVAGIDEGLHVLRAVAVDNLGMSSTSAPVRVHAWQPPTQANFLITEPANWSPDPAHVTLLPAGTSFPLSFTMIETDGFDRPVELLIGTNVVATFTEPPYSTIIAGLGVGEYDLCARSQTNATYRRPSSCLGAHIKLVPLLLQEPTHAADGSFNFRVAGDIPGRTAIIEASTDLVLWQPISTNLAALNSFNFLDDEAVNYRQRFYRVLLSP
jgi:hypothetical protein